MEIFISYQHDDKEVAFDLVDFLEKNDRKCWIAPRDVLLTYAADIVDAISKCSIFLCLISEGTLTSVHVLNELEQAYKYYKDGKLIILPVFVKDVKLTPAMDYYLARIQQVYAHGNIDAAKVEILERINKGLEIITGQKQEATKVKMNSGATNADQDQERVANRYYDVDDKYEKRRLKVEGEVLLRFEKEVFDSLTKGRDHLNGLVTTCMFAKAVMDKIDLSKFDKLIGLCYNEKAVFEANYDYKNETTRFFAQDVEDDDFAEKLESYMKEMNIDKFDYVDISMGFLDWKNPFKVVKTLKKYMRPGCMVYVKDVDDGVVMYYPDEAKLFKKFKTFYALDPIAGFRKSGRRVYSYFQKLKAKSIDLVHSGIDVTDMDEEDKEKMFFAYFGFIPNDFRICYNEDNSRSDFKAIIDWCDEYYDNLEEAFMDDAFFFNSGYFIYKIIM